MNATEFDRWWNDATMRFPSLADWLVRVFPDAQAQRRLLRSWCSVFADTNIADALEVNRLMQTGDLPFVSGHGKDGWGREELLPQHVRRLARQLAYERRSPRAEPDPNYKPTHFPAGKILKRILEMADRGIPSDEAKAIVLAELPVGRPAYEPRYACLLCLDSGRVHVASNTAIEAMLLGQFDRCHHRDAVMRCNCQAGQRLKRNIHGRDIPFETFNEAADFRVTDPLWREPEWQRFEEWVNGQRDKRAEALARTAANYEPAFANFRG